MERGRDELWKPLGSLLVEKGLVAQDALDLALVEHERTGRPLGEVLVDLGVIDSSALRNVLLEQVGVDLTRDSGFGSGLRDELDRRGAEHDAGRASNMRTVIIRELEAVEDVPVDADKLESRRDAELERRERRRIFGRRKSRDAAEDKLSSVVAEFERQSAAIQQSLAELRQLLAAFTADESRRAAEL